MKLQILSDLHLEFGDFTPPETDADVIVLAGDIHVGAKGVKWAKTVFSKPVVYIAGNHEFYGGNLRDTLYDMQEEAKGSNVRILERDSIVIDGIRFVGGTLWTDYRATGNTALAMWDARQMLNDFRKIRTIGYRKTTPEDFMEIHYETRSVIEACISQSQEPIVVVGHHAPSTMSIAECYRGGDHLNAAYVSSLEHLMGVPKIWIHGHTHVSFDYDINGTRVICNPRGYYEMELNPNFNPGLVVEI